MRFGYFGTRLLSQLPYLVPPLWTLILGCGVNSVSMGMGVRGLVADVPVSCAQCSGSLSPFGDLLCYFAWFLPFDHGVPRVPHICFCLVFSFYPVSFGICPGCLLRRRFLRLYVDCGALGMGGWWFIDDSTLRAWSLLRPLILCGEFLWTSVSPLVPDCGREGPLCALLEVYRLPFVGSLQASLCCLRPLCRFAAWALGCVCSADATAVACFGCRGFFLGILAGCVEPFPGF